MSHANQQIRAQVKEFLLGLDTTGENVVTSRVYPMDDAFLPGLVIWTKRMAKAGPETLGKIVTYRTELQVEGRAKADQNIDDVLDDILSEVSEALMEDTTLGGLVMCCEMEEVEYGMGGGLERPHGVVQMTFGVRFKVQADNPQELIYAP